MPEGRSEDVGSYRQPQQVRYVRWGSGNNRCDYEDGCTMCCPTLVLYAEDILPKKVVLNDFERCSALAALEHADLLQ